MSDTLAHGVYVHVPFCVKKCFYCDFNTYALDKAAVTQYLDALQREIDGWRQKLDADGFRRPFDSLFIGGGTPTCLSGKHLDWMVRYLRDAFPLKPGAEVTCEANPGSSNADKFAALAEAGVNRLSIGAQSMDDALLKQIGRTHTAQDVVETMEAARHAGFTNVNLDLIFALPNQTLAQWESTLADVLQLNPDHLSCYSLIIEEGTPFGQWYEEGTLNVPGEDAEATMFEIAIQWLKDAGYDHYEISNFARPHRRSVHNQLYWHIGRYIGLGPGAHGFWGQRRYVNRLLPRDYAQALQSGGDPSRTLETVSRQVEMADVLLFGLRMLDGVDESVFQRRFGTTVYEEFGDELRYLAGEGLIDVDGGRLRLTAKGLPVANVVFEQFLRGGDDDVPAST